MLANWVFLFWVYLLPFHQVDKPSFKGGEKELKSFLEQQMVYPDFSKNNCIEATVFISFKLDENGNVYNAKVEQGTGIDLDHEAIRLVKLTSGKWNIPIDNNVSLTIPINFSLKDFGCEKRSEADRKNAIAYYFIREGLENTVFNYYKNKALGEADELDEPRIEQLKMELGFDDEFIADKLDKAIKMIKQDNIEGACKLLTLVKNLGSNKADDLIAKNCN